MSSVVIYVRALHLTKRCPEGLRESRCARNEKCYWIGSKYEPWVVCVYKIIKSTVIIVAQTITNTRRRWSGYGLAEAEDGRKGSK
jgi:hypothetical protein